MSFVVLVTASKQFKILPKLKNNFMNLVDKINFEFSFEIKRFYLFKLNIQTLNFDFTFPLIIRKP